MFEGWRYRSWFFFAILWFCITRISGLVYQPSGTLARLAMALLAAFLAALIVRALKARLDKVHRFTELAAESHAAIADTPPRDPWLQLGADAQQRADAIQRLFTGGHGAVHFETQWDFEYSHTDSAGRTETAYSSMSFRIARDLADMDARERDCLHAAYLLYNAGVIDAQTWRSLTFYPVYGGGSAAVISCEYREPVALPFRDGPGAIRYYADAHPATLDTTVNTLLAIAAGHAQHSDVPQAVHDVLQRLQRGAAG